MQKTRSILFLREILDQLELEEDTDIAHSASFRHKDLELLTQECHDKYSKLAALVAEVLSPPLRNKSWTTGCLN